jgi:hypothetical protein
MAGLLEALAEHGEARGEEILLPLAFGAPSSLFDYLDEGLWWCCWNGSAWVARARP